MNRLAQMVLTRRTELGEDQVQFAKRLKVHATYVNKIEKGKSTPHPKQFPAFARVLKTTVAEVEAAVAEARYPEAFAKARKGEVPSPTSDLTLGEAELLGYARREGLEKEILALVRIFAPLPARDRDVILRQVKQIILSLRGDDPIGPTGRGGKRPARRKRAATGRKPATSRKRQAAAVEPEILPPESSEMERYREARGARRGRRLSYEIQGEIEEVSPGVQIHVKGGRIGDSSGMSLDLDLCGDDILAWAMEMMEDVEG